MQFNPIQWNSTHGQILQYDVVLDYGANLVITTIELDPALEMLCQKWDPVQY